MDIQPFLGVTDFYHSNFTTVSSIATRIGTALPYHMIKVLKLEYLLWIRPFHTAENQYPAVCKTATVMPDRSLFGIAISTSLKV